MYIIIGKNSSVADCMTTAFYRWRVVCPSRIGTRLREMYVAGKAGFISIYVYVCAQKRAFFRPRKISCRQFFEAGKKWVPYIYLIIEHKS
jgi:hypothetical protein